MLTLTNNEIFALGQAGMAKLDYTVVPVEHAYKVYTLRREIMKVFRSVQDEQGEIVRESFGDRLDDVRKYEENQSGMTKEEYDALQKEARSRSLPMLEELGAKEVELDVKAIPFEAWLELRKGNPFLAGFEDILAGIITENNE